MEHRDAERIRALEVLVELMTAELAKTNAKLDNLLEIKHKGIGVFWLASALLGTGIVGSINVIINWLRGG